MLSWLPICRMVLRYSMFFWEHFLTFEFCLHLYCCVYLSLFLLFVCLAVVSSYCRFSAVNDNSGCRGCAARTRATFPQSRRTEERADGVCRWGWWLARAARGLGETHPPRTESSRWFMVAASARLCCCNCSCCIPLLPQEKRGEALAFAFYVCITGCRRDRSSFS